ncbi:DMT family transporter [Ancylobacter sp. 6x-1]|uniref:DMT family transporter n=1 Tax=Ancylobacter crimeensis TaxID=2579147 RepID=A0ABT0DGE1_9HYPH|nr:DMT family transporter [Ancylobacter crimeensis]
MSLSPADSTGAAVPPARPADSPHAALPLPGRHRLAGIGLMLAAFVLFATLDATVKWLGGHVNAMEIVWARYMGQFVLSCAVLNPWVMPGVWHTRRPVLQVVRSLLLLGTTLGNFFALQYLQLNQTISITFSMPFFVALFAGPMLGEWIGPRRWLAVMVGFAGVLLVVQPGTQSLHPAVFASLASAVCYAFYAITTRQLAASDSTATTMFYSCALGAGLTSLALPFFWSTPQGGTVLVNLGLTGIYGGLGHLLLVIAHRNAPAAVLAPFLYTQIVWMVLAGWLVFNEVPTATTLVGAAIVIASGLYLIARERAERAEAAIAATVPD